jgi:hypothetical protein
MGETLGKALHAAGWVLVVTSAFILGVFFVSWWGRNAPGLGRQDMGWALAFSFAVPLSFYASLAVAALSALGAVAARTRRTPARLYVAALLAALAPLIFLFVVDSRA